MILLISFSLMGLLVLFFCYLIKYKKQAYLISGYNEDEVTDKDGLCNWVGGALIWLGAYTIMTGFLLYKWPGALLSIAVSFTLFTLIVCAIIAAGSKKFKKRTIN